jgi:hypothetical protein
MLSEVQQTGCCHFYNNAGMCLVLLYIAAGTSFAVLEDEWKHTMLGSREKE